jgi:aspartate carbamoyltransferase catalytic subunit
MMPDGRFPEVDLVHDLLDGGPLVPPHLVALAAITRPMVEHWIALAKAVEATPAAQLLGLARGRSLGVMFYQQSTRTRMSFEAAMLRIGGHVVGFADPNTTRAVGFYEETLEDVVRFTAAMVDVLVLRHTETGAAERAAVVSPVPLINAGDGYGEHPTQALGDVLHLHKHFGRLDGLCIGIIGHLGWRAHRSLVTALSLFDVHLAVLEPPGSVPPPDVAAMLQARGVKVTHCADVDEVLRLADAVTTLGVYHSNFHADFSDKANAATRQGNATPDSHRITAAAVQALGRHVPVLHIGPISDHIDRAIDAMPQAHYFRQARDGVWMRAALLAQCCRMNPERTMA